ncbi:glycosyl hydrolase [Hyphomicrobium sp. xq]|uniref:Glycosyl hydrolase n=1 Tax=Hyphomicrobium album TaxID=2665159 RepID=A0A6I3KIC8_9HYPH|nr:glycosyl hydrolase [Hyphomicrobium album]MTD94089.1 glycosyl hydrolase [Hyphomicrobium album]
MSHSADAFLSSVGINIHIDQGYAPQSYVEPLKYLGVRAVRTGAGRVTGSVYVARRTGVLVDIFANGGPVDSFMAAARQLAAANALLALEGPNEPNNFPLTYDGKRGGGSGTWLPVGEFQRDVYAAVKADSELRNFPVFSPSEPGAQTDNVGLQFLTIPEGADALLPPGTPFADFANVHNYVIGNGERYGDNQAWNAADPTLNERWDGLYGNFGVTWGRGYKGYTNEALATLPRVTTETGWDSVRGPGGERTQGTVLVNTYLAQYKRGYRYTFIYQLRDDEGGQDHFGVFDKDSRPKPAATFIHNLTAILADRTPIAHPGRLNYSIPNQPATVHDLLLQKSDGTFALVVWGEKVTGADSVVVDLGGERASVKVYDITVGTEPISTLRNARSVPVSLSDHALIIEVAK